MGCLGGKRRSAPGGMSMDCRRDLGVSDLFIIGVGVSAIAELGRQGKSMDLKEIWTAAAVLMGFQLTAFIWRLNRETEVRKSGGKNWLPPADYLSLASMIAIAFGVYAFPIAGYNLL
jgi:hypothetical protein